ncbi:hypothetical protein [Sphingopyxis indica]|uniref:Uncharacterized protein n=1 Tax=Sphingopyxis indica TaxID=436663 RepID=A0A239K3N5_9SPHN|nr:hypothetical protein [Sphingopyxis indica]SNT12745.1 hypothetical protein SAMN06295955_11279 [Sphingopyxis indica]
MNFRRPLAAGAALSLIAGCTPTDVTLGNAVRTTMAAQVVDPDPQYDDPIPTTDGAKAGAAVERYRTDRVKKPVGIRTTSGQSGSGSPK